jgi:cytoskeletal protein RodZ
MMKENQIKSIGMQLGEARLMQKKSIQEMAKQTKLHEKTIQRLEKDEFDLLPNSAYVRGFIRIYAKSLGLNEYELLHQFDGTVHDDYELDMLTPEALEVLPNRHQPPSVTTRGVTFGVVAVIIFLALAIVGIKFYQISPVLIPEKKGDMKEISKAIISSEMELAIGQKTGEVADAKVMKAIAVSDGTGENKEEAVPAFPNRLEVAADPEASEEDTWLRVVAIRNKEEVLLFEGTFVPGIRIPATTGEPWMADAFVVTTKKAEVINIIYNGVNYGKFDKAGAQRFRIPME